MALHVRRTLSWPDYDEAYLTAPVSRARRRTGAVEFERAGPRAAAEAAPRGGRPAFDDLGAPRPTGEPNQIANHPPLYYAGVGLVSAAVDLVVPGSLPFDQAVWVMRAVSIALMSVLPGLAYAVARRAGASRSGAVAAAAFPLVIPQLAHIGASVNNDVLVVTLFAVLTWQLTRVLEGDTAPRLAAWTGVVVALALLTKGFALVLPPWIAATYAIAAWRQRSWRPVGAGALALGVGGAGGGWWWVRNVLVFGTVQPAISTVGPPGPDFTPRLAYWWPRFQGRIVNRFWGEFGYFDVILPRPAIISSTVATLTGFVSSLLAAIQGHMRSWRRGRADADSASAAPDDDGDAPGFRIGEVVVLAYPTLALLALVAYGSWQSHVRTGLTPGIQGRYLFPGVVGLGALLGIGFGWLLREWRRALPVLVLLWATALHVLAIPRILTTYWGEGPNPSLASAIDGVVAWAPWPIGVTAAVGVFTIAAYVWALLQVLEVAPDGARS